MSLHSTEIHNEKITSAAMDCSPPGSSVHGISQAKILEWVAFPTPGDLSIPRIKAAFPAVQLDSLPIFLSF